MAYLTDGLVDDCRNTSILLKKQSFKVMLGLL